MANPVFTYIPNLIGYGRVALLLASCAMMSTCPKWTVFLYAVSGLLDAVDGHAARYFQQSTKFGAVLDMVTDRSSTACLLIYLAVLYPDLAVYAQIITAIDISSHYMHMYSALIAGQTSHKTMQKGEWALLKLYYENKAFLFTLCAGNELFFISLYINKMIAPEWHFAPPYHHLKPFGILVLLTAPLMIVKQVMNTVQLVRAAIRVAEVDAPSTSGKSRTAPITARVKAAAETVMSTVTDLAEKSSDAVLAKGRRSASPAKGRRSVSPTKKGNDSPTKKASDTPSKKSTETPSKGRSRARSVSKRRVATPLKSQ